MTMSGQQLMWFFTKNCPHNNVSKSCVYCVMLICCWKHPKRGSWLLVSTTVCQLAYSYQLLDDILCARRFCDSPGVKSLIVCPLNLKYRVYSTDKCEQGRHSKYALICKLLHYVEGGCEVGMRCIRYECVGVRGVVVGRCWGCVFICMVCTGCNLYRHLHLQCVWYKHCMPCCKVGNTIISGVPSHYTTNCPCVCAVCVKLTMVVYLLCVYCVEVRLQLPNLCVFSCYKEYYYHS